MRPPGAHRPVETADVRAVLHRDLHPEAGEIPVEDARGIPLVVGDLVLREPLVRDSGEERVEQPLHAGRVVRLQQPLEPGPVLLDAGRVRGQAPQQVLDFVSLCLKTGVNLDNLPITFTHMHKRGNNMSSQQPLDEARSRKARIMAHLDRVLDDLDEISKLADGSLSNWRDVRQKLVKIGTLVLRILART